MPKPSAAATYRAKIKFTPVSTIIEYERNARLHSDDQVARIAESIKSHGFLNPILIDDHNVVVAGHGRIRAARLVGLQEVPTIKISHLSEDEINAYRIIDNQYALLSSWDAKLIGSEITQLRASGYSLDTLGFSELQLRGWDIDVGNVTGNDPEATPEPPKNPISRPGDLWILGDHRLLCGDATSESDVAMCLGGAKPHLMVTDQPYGVEYDANWRNERHRANGKAYGASAVGKVKNDDRVDWSAAWKLFAGDVAYVWTAGLRSRESIEALESAGFVMRAQIIWVKARFVISRGDYHFQHEPCWYAVRKGRTGKWAGDRSQTTVWNIGHTKSETGHSTQKPIECMKRPIENNSKKGDSVYEPFSGSGTTIVACEMTGRKALAIEIDPAYVDVAVQRWEQFTGEKAIRRPAEGTHAPKRKGRPEAAPSKKAAPKGSATPPNSAMRGRLSPSGASSRPRVPVAERSLRAKESL